MKKIKVAPFMPEEVEVIGEEGSNRAQIIAYPFESGYAVTLAHPLRRLIMSSSIGYAPIAIKIDGASHEFDAIRGMHQDVAVFIINLKKTRFKLKDPLQDRVEVSYRFSGSKEVVAADLNNDQVEVINGDLVLATLNEDAELNFTLQIAKGIGYVPSEDLRDEVAPDAIVLDAFFTPVKRANYAIETMLVEDDPNYEKITFDIETDGQISAKDAFVNALEVMSRQLAVFGTKLNATLTPTSSGSGSESDLKPYLVPVHELGLSARSSNSLDRAGIHYIGQLILMSESEMKEIKNLGKKSLDEINDCLQQHGFGEDFSLSEDVAEELRAQLEKLTKDKT